MAITDNVLTGGGLQYVWDYKIVPQLAAKANTSSLATVATTGNYSDLLGTPTIDSQVTVLSTNAVQSGAVYNFVNSSIATNTAYFIGTFTSVSDLHAYSGTVTNNDYGFVVSNYVVLISEPSDWEDGGYYEKTENAPGWKANKYYSKNGDVYTLTTSEPPSWDTNYTAYYTRFNENDYTPVIGVDSYHIIKYGDVPTFVTNTYYAREENTYSRYKYTPEHGWEFEYTLNNSSFTAAQWATIQSGFTADDKAYIMSEIPGKAPIADVVTRVYCDTFSNEYALWYDKGNNLYNIIDIDTSPTYGSANLITSGAVYNSLSSKADASTTLSGYGITDANISDGTITLGSSTLTPLTSSNVTSTYSSSGTSPVNGKAVNAAIGTLDVSSVGGAGYYIQAISETNGKISATTDTIDTTATADSAHPITSGAVASIQTTLSTTISGKASVSDIRGTGTALTTGTDLDDITALGAYNANTGTIAGSLTNCPTSSPFRMDVMTLNGSTRYIQKIITYESSNTALRVYMRAYTSSGWTSWFMFEGTAV